MDWRSASAQFAPNGVERHIELALAALDDWIEITDEARMTAKAVIKAYRDAQLPQGKKRGPRRSKRAQQIVRDMLIRHDMQSLERRRGLRIGHDILEATSRQINQGTSYPIYRDESRPKPHWK